MKTKVHLFLVYEKYEHPASYWSLRTNFVAVTNKDLTTEFHQHVVQDYDNDGRFKFYDPQGNRRYLVEDAYIPFYKLAKYGGYII